MTDSSKDRPPRILGRLKARLRQVRALGLTRVLYSVPQRLSESRWCRRWLTFFVVDMLAAQVAEMKRSERLPTAYVVRYAGWEDRPALEAFALDPRSVAGRLRRGDRCVITLASARIVAAVWLVTGPADHAEDLCQLGCTFHIPAGTCLTYDGRGTRWGAWGSLMGHLPRLLDAIGIAEVITLIDCNNRQSLDSHESLRYRRVGKIGMVAILGWTLSFYQFGAARWRVVRGRLGRVSVRDIWSRAVAEASAHDAEPRVTDDIGELRIGAGATVHTL